MTSYKRKLPPTGYWIFICNRAKWRAEDWLSDGHAEVRYRISKHNRHEFRVGDLGLLRVSGLRGRAGSASKGGRGAGVLAIFEVIGETEFSTYSDGYEIPGAFNRDTPKWRVPVRVVERFLSKPISISEFPKGDSFKYLLRPLQASTIPIERGAFEKILSLRDLSISSLGDVPAIHFRPADNVLVDTLLGIAELEKRFANETPRVKEYVSRKIERGTIGQRVKLALQGRCQICSEIGQDPIAFRDRNGSPYSEAHHVIPVSTLTKGSLSCLNIMVLCPNHHREIHFGDFEIIENTDGYWRVRLGSRKIKVDKTKL